MGTIQQSYYNSTSKPTKKLFKDCFAAFYRPKQLLEFNNQNSALKRGLRYNGLDKKGKGVIEVGEKDEDDQWWD